MIALALRYWYVLVIAGLLALLGVQQIRVDHAHTDLAEERQSRAEENSTRERTAREQEAANNRTALARFNQAQDAVNAGRIRETSLRADADSALSERDRLRDAVAKATARRRDVPGQPGPAGAQPADPIGELFNSCTAEVQELARIADRHANDVQTLIEAWPK